MKLSQPTSIGISLLTFVTSVVALVVIYLQQRLPMHPFFLSSDALYLPALYVDLFRDGGSLKDWYLTPAPYFLPDWPLYFAVMRIFGSPYLAAAGFFVVQIALSFALLTALNRRLLNPTRALCAAACSMVLCCLLAGGRFMAPFHFILLSGHHYGSFLFLLLGTWLILRGLQRDSHDVRPIAAALLLVCAVAALSDKLFVVQFAAPACITLFAVGLGIRERLPQARLLAAGIAAGSIAGVLLYRLAVAHPVDTSSGFSLQSFDQNAQEIWTLFKTLGSDTPLAAALIGIFYLATAAYVMLYWTRVRQAATARIEFFFLAAFSLLASAVLLAALLFNTMPLNGRYMIPLFFLPFVFGPSLLLAGVNRPRVATAALQVLGLAAAWTIANAAATHYTGLQFEHYPDDIACMDAAASRLGLRNGIGGYWEAKRNTILSRQGLQVAAVLPNLSPYEWITSLRMFKPRYDFVIISEEINGLPQADLRRIVEINGPPATKVACGRVSMYVYPKGTLRTTAPAP